MASPSTNLKNIIDLLEANGYRTEKMVIGIYELTPDEPDSFMEYDYHFKAATKDDASAQSMLSHEIWDETGFQARAQYDKDNDCPKCGSWRYSIRQRGDGPGRVKFTDECMDCDYEQKHVFPEGD